MATLNDLVSQMQTLIESNTELQKQLETALIKIDKLEKDNDRMKKQQQNQSFSILLTNKKHYYFTLLYFTGSYNHNIIMRRIALKKGLSLSEYGFTDLKTNKLLDYNVNSEEDIFKIIDMEYVKPENRV